jgi:hypothetical protein
LAKSFVLQLSTYPIDKHFSHNYSQNNVIWVCIITLFPKTSEKIIGNKQSQMLAIHITLSAHMSLNLTKNILFEMESSKSTLFTLMKTVLENLGN